MFVQKPPGNRTNLRGWWKTPRDSLDKLASLRLRPKTQDLKTQEQKTRPNDSNIGFSRTLAGSRRITKATDMTAGALLAL